MKKCEKCFGAICCSLNVALKGCQANSRFNREWVVEAERLRHNVNPSDSQRGIPTSTASNARAPNKSGPAFLTPRAAAKHPFSTIRQSLRAAALL